MYGSDAPFSYIRGEYVYNPSEGVRAQSQLKFSWVKESEYQIYQYKIGKFKMIHLHTILAIKEVIDSLHLKSKEEVVKEYIFYKNSAELFGKKSLSKFRDTS